MQFRLLQEDICKISRDNFLKSVMAKIADVTHEGSIPVF
jgi:hypothetical protein